MLSSLPSNLLYHRWVLNIKHWRKYQFGRNKYWWVGAKKYNLANLAKLAKKTVSSSAAAAGWRGRDGCLLSVAPKVRARWFYEKREIHSRKNLVGSCCAESILLQLLLLLLVTIPFPSFTSNTTCKVRGLFKFFYNGNINVHNKHQDQLELKEHAVDRRGWANIQFWRYHQVPVEGYIICKTSPFFVTR